MASKNRLVKFLHQLAETMEIPPRQLAAAALEYATSVFGQAGAEDEARSIEAETQVTAVPPRPPVEPYTGSVHLCLDFGTAMSKAFAWDKDSDVPMPLRIGRAAGEPGSPYALDSVIFISRDGLVFFGQAAVNHAAAADPEHHRAFLSIKDILTVGPMTDLQESVPSQCNPSGRPVNNKEVVALYLAFLTDSALLALRADFQEDSRNIPRSYTKPVFDQNRDGWATKILTDCANVGQALVDRFSGQWASGIPLDELRTAVAEANSAEEHFVVESGILPEPIAAFASRIRNVFPKEYRRRLMMVIDVGAGTTDFAMFARVEREEEMRLYRIKNSVTTIRIAGDAVDNALMDYLLLQTGVTEGHSRIGAIKADLKRDIRLVKEELFTTGAVTRHLVNDLRAEARLEDFEECPAMIRLRDAIQEKFHKVLLGIDNTWLILAELEVYFTGGGASLRMVTRLADNQPITVGESIITPIPVTRSPPWLEEECEDVVDSYPQLAVCIGGACHGAGRINLDVDREYQHFVGGLADAQWKPGGFRDGQ